MLDSFFLDARHVIRALARSPIFVFVAVLSVGAGIGVNTAAFSWLDSLVLHPFPVITEPERVVGLETLSPGRVESPVSYPVIREWTEARSLTGLAAWTLTRVAGRSDGDANATPLIAMLVSGSYFDVLEVRSSLGRLLVESDERERTPVVVLSHGFWLRQYGGDPTVRGRTIFLNGLPFAVVGVTPPRFAGTYLGVVPDVFVPVTLHPALTAQNVLDDRRARVFQTVARLAPGVTRAEAQHELDGVARLVSEEAGDRPVTSAIVKDVRTQFLGGLVFPILSATLVVTVILLLVACANVASLLLVRATARRSELAVRVALGAPPSRLARLVLMEAVALSAAGGVVGVAIAFLARGTLASLFPTAAYPLTLPIDLNGRVLLVALGSVVVVTILCSWLPATRAAGASPASALRTGRQSNGRWSTRARSAIVSLQLAFSLLTLVAAGQFVRALQRGASIDPGFSDPGSMVLVGTDLGVARLDDTAAVAALEQVLARTRELPGVVAATAATFVPLGLGGVRTVDVRVDGFTPSADESMSSVRALVGSDYAHTMGIRVLSGRDLTGQDRGGTTLVALVNETLARRFWPNGSALGRRIDAGRGWATIVGVVADGKYGALTEAPQLAVYLPIAQWPQRSITIHVRTTGDPLALVPPVRDVLTSVHPDLAVLQPRTLATHITGATFIPRIGTRVLGAFALTALALAAFGLYGALAVAVALRSKELAIRTALGASRFAIIRSICRQVASVAGAGMALGSALAVLAARALGTQMPEIGFIDPASYMVGVSVLLGAVALAAWLPTRRATRADPLTVLRSD